MERLENKYQKIITTQGFHKIIYNYRHILKFQNLIDVKSFIKLELREAIFIFKKL